ncbi:hypothetical protein K488DRAFT_89317 [Vararia minispora EC-137]|uniref:Uncharacterized protein n=1 Tax=Vararia minispora EC-137 TaxID=1314806 RepID=A0ACB8QAM0_9AGAM|nr:hypothetical protein K488DRAFT_89317 [Vararia minispora EC-137]
MQAGPETQNSSMVVIPSADPSYHPLFSMEDADVVLSSCDGTLFRVPSATLKMTSSWFRTMFKLPQPPASSTTDIITLSEDSVTLEGLLRMVCGIVIPTLTCWDDVEPILYAAEKYDMPGPHSIIRALAHTPPFLNEPLRLFAAACRYDWPDEARLASTLSLALDLADPLYRPDLLKLKTSALLALQDLHRARLAGFRARLSQPPFLTDVQMADGSGQRCRCGEPFDYGAWRELKYAMERELERRPKGDTVREGLEEWHVAKVCWASRCRRSACNNNVYDVSSTTRAIRDAIDSLPSAIEAPVE